MAQEASPDGAERSPVLETDRLAESTKYLPDLPHPAVSLAVALPVSLVLGAVLLWWAPDTAMDDRPYIVELLAVSLLLFALPIWVGGLFTWVYLRAIGGNAYLYRTTVVALALQVMVLLFLVPGVLITAVDPAMLTRREYLLLALSAPVLFLHLINHLSSTERWALALPATLSQPLVAMTGALLLYFADQDWSDPGPIVLVVVFLASQVGLGHMALYVGTRPMARAYGVDGTGVFRAFLEHWVSGGDAGRPEMEAFFRTFAEPSYAKAEVVSFRERGGSPLATVVVPSLHPGPWGELGGSNLPRKLQRALKDEHGQVLVFHGASEHDLNPVDEVEIGKLSSLVKTALDDMEGWSDRASPSVRVTDGTDALAQAFNGAVMAVQTSAPNPTDDVDWPVGHAIEQEMAKLGADPGVFIDGHNCLLPGAGHVPFGSAKARRIEGRVVEATREAISAQRGGLRVGVGHVPNEGEFWSMGPTGIQALVVEVDGQRTAWVLADGNNMAIGLRERIRDVLLERVEEAEVLTTDNHIVNVTVGGFNPVGMGDDQDLLVQRCLEAVDMALADTRDAEVAAAHEEADEVMVWGKGNAIRLMANLNAAITTGKFSLTLAVTAGLLVGLVAIWLV